MNDTDPTKVLQVLGSSAGGVARHVAQISAALAAAAPVADRPASTVRIAGPASVRPIVLPGETRDVGFEPVEIADRPGPADVASVRRLRQLARGADVVHAHGLRAGALAALAVRGLRRSARPRLVVTLHNLPVGARAVRAVSQVLERIVARCADVVLGVSLDLVELARRRGARVVARALVPAPERRSARTPPEEVRAGLGLEPGQRLLVTVGRLAPQKGLETLCDAAALLGADRQGPGAAGAGPDELVWVVAGGGPLEAMVRDQVAARSLPVRLLGFRDDAPDLLGAADVVVSTAVWEGQPLWLQEALGAGAAVVATDAGGTREVTGTAARLVPVGDAAAVAGAVRALLDDDTGLRTLREHALRRAAELPTVTDVVVSLLPFYRGT